MIEQSPPAPARREHKDYCKTFDPPVGVSSGAFSCDCGATTWNDCLDAVTAWLTEVGEAAQIEYSRPGVIMHALSPTICNTKYEADRFIALLNGEPVGE